jgi:hypothetical protein
MRRDPGITLNDSLATIRDVSIIFDFPKFTFGSLRSGCLEEWSSKELNESGNFMVIRSS